MFMTFKQPQPEQLQWQFYINKMSKIVINKIFPIKPFTGWLECVNGVKNVDTTIESMSLIPGSIHTESSHMNKQEQSCSNTLS